MCLEAMRRIKQTKDVFNFLGPTRKKGPTFLAPAVVTLTAEPNMRNLRTGSQARCMGHLVTSSLDPAHFTMWGLVGRASTFAKVRDKPVG